MRETRSYKAENFYLRGLVAWVRWVVLRPRVTLALSLAGVSAASIDSADRVRMNSDNRQLVRQDAPFRQNYTEYLAAFPEFEDTTLVVLTSDSIDSVEDAQRRLSSALRERTDVIASVYAPGADSYRNPHWSRWRGVHNQDHRRICRSVGVRRPRARCRVGVSRPRPCRAA